jgi:hypothetical protein
MVQCLIIDLTKFNSHFRHLFSKTPIWGTKSLSPRQTLNGGFTVCGQSIFFLGLKTILPKCMTSKARIYGSDFIFQLDHL